MKYWKMSFKICFRGLLKKKNVEWQTEKSTYLYDTRNYQNNRDVTRIENEAFFMCLHFYFFLSVSTFIPTKCQIKLEAKH